MDETTHLAIQTLCTIIDGFPAARRDDAIRRTGLAVGRSADPTGIPTTADQPIKHLYWDLTIDELRDRMIQLVDEVGIDEATIVLGVIHNLDWHFERHADREFSDDCRDSHIATVNGLRADLEKPLDERDYRESDDGINDFIQKIKNEIENVEKSRQEAEDALHYLREKTADVFTWQFWHALTSHKLGDPKRLLDDLDSSDDGT